SSLSQTAANYIVWAETAVGAGAPEHGHQVEKPMTMPRIDEIGREPEMKGEYRTDPYGDISEHYGELRKLLADRSPAAIERIRGETNAGNLRGMGGAGKPFLRKFDQVLKADSPEKYVVANADESEPGTIKDREILLRFPHLLLEALAVAGIAVGAKK